MNHLCVKISATVSAYKFFGTENITNHGKLCLFALEQTLTMSCRTFIPQELNNHGVRCSTLDVIIAPYQHWLSIVCHHCYGARNSPGMLDHPT